MNNYHIVGIIVLVGLSILAGLTFWPQALVPTPSSTANVPTVEEKPTIEKPAAQKPSTVSYPGAGARTYEKGYYVTTIFYTDQGFVPQQVTANHGEEIRFVNKTSKALRINADSSSSSQYYRNINQSETVFKNGTFQFQLPEVGVYNYLNFNSNPKKTGQILVK